MRVEVDGVRIFFDVEGAALRPDGPLLAEHPTVVVVHTGPGSDHTAYKEHIGPYLAQDAQVLYLDQRGCGRSDRSDPSHWNVDTWASDLRALLRRLGVERPIVLGAGFGTFVALRYAQRWPDELSKLVLANPAARVLPTRLVARYDELGGPLVGEVAHEFLENPNETTIAAFLRHCFPVMVPLNDPARLILLPIWNLELAVHWTATEMRTIDLRPDLDAITVPTLVLAGTDDPQYPLASIEEVIEGLGDVHVERYPGARHSVFRDAPQCLEAVRRFVA